MTNAREWAAASSAWFRNWAPRHNVSDKAEDHMKRMYSVGEVGSRIYFNPVISGISACCIWIFVFWAMATQAEAVERTQEAQAWVTDVWNWLYMFSQNVWIVVLVYILYRYSNLKLGKDTDEPEFSDATYFAMLFSCGVATGLWYFTAEAMWHYEGYGSPRWVDSSMWNDNTRAEHAIMVTFFHWGVHGWIPYTTVGALIALLSYRRGFPMSMRFTLYPLIGEMCYGVLGDLIEVLSILCTIFGVCTSLGLGAAQINKGLVRLDRGTYHGKDANGCDTASQLVCSGSIGVQQGTGMQVVIIIIITVLATMSVIAGLKAGIAALSQIAFALSVFLVLCVLLLDDTWYILNALTSALGYYIWYLPKIAFHTDAWEELGGAANGKGGAPDDRGGRRGWMNNWTIFYWGWWISWGPFVGTFLARISKGRKLGNFIMATLIVPSIWSCTFMGVFGAAQIRISNQAIAAGLNGSSSALTFGSQANKSAIGYNIPNENGVGTYWQPVSDYTVRLYSLATEDVLFEHLQAYGGPGWSTLMSFILMMCIVLYFVTSSDSASFVVDIMAANGLEEPPLFQKIFWASTEGAAAAALLLSAGDGNPTAALDAVKALPIILGLPFTFLLCWMSQALLLVCQEESGDLRIERKNFSIFLFNLEPETFMAVAVPFLPLGRVASKVWGRAPRVYSGVYGAAWAVMLLLILLQAADPAFGPMAAATYFMIAIAVAGLRVAVRIKLGITGDMASDLCTCCFAFPFAIGQMAVEDFGMKKEETVEAEDTSSNTADDHDYEDLCPVAEGSKSISKRSSSLRVERPTSVRFAAGVSDDEDAVRAVARKDTPWAQLRPSFSEEEEADHECEDLCGSARSSLKVERPRSVRFSLTSFDDEEIGRSSNRKNTPWVQPCSSLSESLPLSESAFCQAEIVSHGRLAGFPQCDQELLLALKMKVEALEAEVSLVRRSSRKSTNSSIDEAAPLPTPPATPRLPGPPPLASG